MENKNFKNHLLKQLGLAVGLIGLLAMLWEFGLEGALTKGMGASGAHALSVFVVIGIALLALIYPASILLNRWGKLFDEVETELGTTERRYRSIVESTNDIILEINADEKIVFTNPAVKLLGYDREELVGQSIQTLIEADQWETVVPRVTTRRIGPRATLNFPVTLLTNDNSVLSEEVPAQKFLVDASGLWKESDEIVRTKGTEKHFIGTLFIARVVVNA